MSTAKSSRLNQDQIDIDYDFKVPAKLSAGDTTATTQPNALASGPNQSKYLTREKITKMLGGGLLVTLVGYFGLTHTESGQGVLDHLGKIKDRIVRAFEQEEPLTEEELLALDIQFLREHARSHYKELKVESDRAERNGSLSSPPLLLKLAQLGLDSGDLKDAEVIAKRSLEMSDDAQKSLLPGNAVGAAENNAQRIAALRILALAKMAGNPPDYVGAAGDLDSALDDQDDQQDIVLKCLLDECLRSSGKPGVPINRGELEKALADERKFREELMAKFKEDSATDPPMPQNIRMNKRLTIARNGETIAIMKRALERMKAH